MRDRFYDITVETMESIWGRTPRLYQSVVIPHLLRMMCGVLVPSPVLLVQSTGTGKSSVPLTAATVDGGITIIVQNTLALGSDQASKIATAANASAKHVKSYQLDACKDEEVLSNLCDAITHHCMSNIDTSIIIFTSPEYLLKPHVMSFFVSVVEKDLLRLFCIDEVHLFVQFGLSFRQSFQLIKKSTIDKLIDKESGQMHVPILCMTATFNNKLMNLLENMLGFTIEKNNIFWGDMNSFAKRNIFMSMKCTHHQFKSTCEDIATLSTDDYSSKCIILTSTAKKAKKVQNKLDIFLDKNENIVGDSIVVIGNQETELKHAFTTTFTNVLCNDADDYSDSVLCPRFLIGTPGCIGAGLDCNAVSFVKRLGIPTGVIDFAQELGRCGRDVSDTATSNCYSINFTMNDYVYLVERLFKIEKKKTIKNNSVPDLEQSAHAVERSILSKSKERDMLLFNLQELCSILFLNRGCWHSLLEVQLANTPHDQLASNYHPCCTMCPYCNGEQEKMFKRTSRVGLQKFLVDAMYKNAGKNYAVEDLSKMLCNYPNVGKDIYRRPKSTKACNQTDTSLTILQLLSANIIHLEVKESDTPKGICKLSFTGINPNYTIPHYWHCIRTFEC